MAEKFNLISNTTNFDSFSCLQSSIVFSRPLHISDKTLTYQCLLHQISDVQRPLSARHIPSIFIVSFLDYQHSISISCILKFSSIYSSLYNLSSHLNYSLETMDDLRLEELETIKAIFAENVQIDVSTHSGTIPIVASFPAETTINLYSSDSTLLCHTKVSHVSAISLHFVLLEGYPSLKPPLLEISSPLLTEAAKSALLEEFHELWAELRDQVLFTIIDLLQQKATHDLFALFGQSINDFVDPTLYETVVDFDRQRKHELFQLKTFTCEICQLEVKGDGCVEFEHCGHVFCRRCLNDFFSSLINNGEVEKIHCPNFECSKAIFKARELFLAADYLARENFDFEQFKADIMTHPIKVDVLQRVLGLSANGSELFDKYMKLFTDHQHMLIAKLFPHRLVSCPRKSCPAMIFRENMVQRLVICRNCNYAFCHICRKSFHSDSIDCAKSRQNQQYLGVPIEAMEIWLANEDSKERGNLRYKYGFDLMQKMSNEYLMDKLFNELLLDESQEFSKCPTCDLVIQRMEGCNKMRCSACYTFFCNVCGVYLSHDKPYEHFNEKSSSCYGKLFHGMPGMDPVY